MRSIIRNNIAIQPLPGRDLQRAIGKDSYSESKKMTVGFAMYGGEGEFPPHMHAEEAVYVVNCKDAWILFGDSAEKLDGRERMHPGMLLHIGEGEWHKFVFEQGGYADLMFIYGQVDNIRPEDKGK